MWWIAALAAATIQTLRNGFAKDIATTISPVLNTWARFAFNLPWAVGSVALSLWFVDWPVLTPGFFVWCGIGALGQLSANVALVGAFRRANFAESIALHKLEVVFTAIVGASLFGEHPSALGWAGIGISGLGTLAINLGRGRGPQGWRRAFHLDAGALMALACGGLLVAASFGVKGAVTELAAANPGWDSSDLLVPTHTLLHVTWIEVVLLTAVLLWREPKSFRAVPRNIRPMAALGTLAWASSFCWYWAFSLSLVAYVRAVGQIEAVLSVLLAIGWWKERDALRQVPGVALVVAGVLLILLG